MFVRGGLQEWIHSGAARTADAAGYLDRTASGGMPVPRSHREFAALRTGPGGAGLFFLKPIYTMLSLGGDRRALDQPLARPGRLALVDDLLLHRRELLRGQLPGLRGAVLFAGIPAQRGHVAGMGFGSYALLDGLDRRIIMLSDASRRCAAIGLCGRCIKHADVPCGLRRLFCLAPAAGDGLLAAAAHRRLARHGLYHAGFRLPLRLRPSVRFSDVRELVLRRRGVSTVRAFR